MTDPYKILGVSPNASDEQIKAAYRELAKKYHPDNYAGNPLSDLAEEKMQEINRAYDEISKQRKNAQAGGTAYGNSASYHYGGGSGGSQFADIRRLINSGRIAEAQELLDGVAAANRDAEWYFLRGSIHYSRGWLDDALQCFQKACSMSPQNAEYAAAYNQLVWQRQSGRPSGYGSYPQGGASLGGCSCCDICAALWCADCCMNGCF